MANSRCARRDAGTGAAFALSQRGTQALRVGDGSVRLGHGSFLSAGPALQTARVQYGSSHIDGRRQYVLMFGEANGHAAAGDVTAEAAQVAVELLDANVAGPAGHEAAGRTSSLLSA